MQQHHAKGIVALSCLVIVGVIASLIFSSLSSNVNGNGGQPTPRSYLPNVSSADSPSAAAALEILPNSSAYVDNQGQLHIVGEVHNWAADSWDLTMQANVMDASSRVIDHGNGGLNALSLLPNAVGCFDVILPIAPPGWSTYTLSVSQSALSYIGYAPLDATKVSAQSISSNEYRVMGRIQNKLGVAAKAIIIISTLYDSKGKVIACNTGIPNNTVLSDTTTTYFVNHFTGAGFGDVSSSSFKAYGIPVTATHICNSSDPNWRGGSTNYPFCVAQDLEWTNGSSNPWYVSYNTDQTIGVKWDVYGIAGLWLKVEGNGDKCGPAGSTGTFSVAINGSGTYYWNANTMGYGGYLVHLYVLRNDGVYVYHNEKYLCVGFDGSGPTNTPAPATSTNTPLSTATPVPIPTLAP